MAEEGFCDVSIGGYDGDDESIEYSEAKLEAPEATTCCECGRSVAAGERISRYKANDDSDIVDVCAECHEAIREFCDGHAIGTLWEEFGIQWDGGAHVQACLNRLQTAAAKKHLHTQWLKWKGLALGAADKSEGSPHAK